MNLEFFAAGRPAPQGSKVYFGNGGGREASKYLKAWRESVKWAAHNARTLAKIAYFRGAVFAEVTFYLPRPKCHENAIFCSTTPDVDKLLRATFDALTASGLIIDDRKIVMVKASKVYGLNGKIGAQILLKDADK